MSGKTVTKGSGAERRFQAGAFLTSLCLCLSACAVSGPASDVAAANRPLLTPASSITGARLYAPPGPVFGALARPVPPATVAPTYLNFLAPSAVAARNNAMYVADIGHRQLLRYDAAYMALSRFSDYPAGSVTALAVGPDMSLYVADADAGRVMHFSWDGRLLLGFSSDMAMGRPVGILLNDASGQVLVADNLYNHVVIFNSLGRPTGTLKSQRMHSLAAMAGGPDGLYLVDRLGREVVVMGLDGEDRYALGDGALKDPAAIAVDGFNRVFVADAFDDSIKVFVDGEMAASFGAGHGGASFNRIASLFIERDILYVADSMNRRIQTFRIAPPATARPANE